MPSSHSSPATVLRSVSPQKETVQPRVQVAVLSTASLDNRLRIDLATNIYGNPLFWNEAIRNIPPIRIIVDNLHVTLAGVVNSEVDKRVAADIVRQTAGVLTFRNNLETRRSRRG